MKVKFDLNKYKTSLNRDPQAKVMIDSCNYTWSAVITKLGYPCNYLKDDNLWEMDENDLIMFVLTYA